MLSIFGAMSLAKVAKSSQDLEGLKIAAKQGGVKDDLALEDTGRYLYARAVFMGYDLPNGNGDAIPGFYAGIFGPSFIGKNLDLNHDVTPEGRAGTIMATWHVLADMGEVKGPVILGRNARGYDLDSRVPVFRLSAEAARERKELQLEGIFRCDRELRAGKILADRLMAGTLDSVSQEASTAYCVCPVCTHRIQAWHDMPCDHLMPGSLMMKAYSVPGYEGQILAHKMHHEPSGTGLGGVDIPAYERGKVNELTAQMKQGTLTAAQMRQVIRQQEMVWGKTEFVLQASKEVELIAADIQRQGQSEPPKVILMGGEKPVVETPEIKASLATTIRSLAAAEGDAPAVLRTKAASLAGAQARLNAESSFLARQATLANQAETLFDPNLLTTLAQSIGVLAEAQMAIDDVRKGILTALKVELPKGLPEGMLLASTGMPAVKALLAAFAARVPNGNVPAVIAARNRVDTFVQAAKSFQSVCPTDFKPDFSEAYTKFSTRFDHWKGLDFKSSSAAVETAVAYREFAEIFAGFTASQSALKTDFTAARAVDAAFDIVGSVDAPRRLRMRAGTADVLAGLKTEATLERQRAVVEAMADATKEWISPMETRGLSWAAGWVEAPKTSAEAAALINGLSAFMAGMGRSKVAAAVTSKLIAYLKKASDFMGSLVKAERLEAKKNLVARAWRKEFEATPTPVMFKAYQRVLAAADLPNAAGDGNLEMATEIGLAMQADGGPWPWSESDKPRNWSQFLEDKTDDELKASAQEWRARLNSASSEAKVTIEQNLRRLETVMADRGLAAGIAASFCRKPDFKASYWLLRAADGSVAGRVSILAAAGGDPDRGAVIGGKEVWLADHLASPTYGSDLVSQAKAFGLKATLKQFEKVKAGGGAGIFVKNFEIADGGEGRLDLTTGKITWTRFPTIEKFDLEGYQDGMTDISGKLLEISAFNVDERAAKELAIEIEPEAEPVPAGKTVRVEVANLKGDFVWGGGYIRTTPKVGDIIQSGESQGFPALEARILVDGESSDTGDSVGVFVDFKVTEDFIYFYKDVFDPEYHTEEQAKEYAIENGMNLEEVDLEELARQMDQDNLDDARLNWKAAKAAVEANMSDLIAISSAIKAGKTEGSGWNLKVEGELTESVIKKIAWSVRNGVKTGTDPVWTMTQTSVMHKTPSVRSSKVVAMNAADIIGWAYNGAAYCDGCKPEAYLAGTGGPGASETPMPIFGVEADSFAGHPCDKCGGEIVEADKPEKTSDGLTDVEAAWLGNLEVADMRRHVVVSRIHGSLKSSTLRHAYLRAAMEGVKSPLQAAKLAVAGNAELHRIAAAGKLSKMAVADGSAAAGLLGGNAPLTSHKSRMFASSFFTFPSAGTLMACSFTAFADGSRGIAWRPMDAFASAREAAGVLAGRADLSADGSAKMEDVLKAMATPGPRKHLGAKVASMAARRLAAGYDVDDVKRAGYTLDPMTCRKCGSSEVTFNQGVGDAYCAACGTWQSEVKKPVKANLGEPYIKFSNGDSLMADEVLDAFHNAPDDEENFVDEFKYKLMSPDTLTDEEDDQIRAIFENLSSNGGKIEVNAAGKAVNLTQNVADLATARKSLIGKVDYDSSQDSGDPGVTQFSKKGQPVAWYDANKKELAVVAAWVTPKKAKAGQGPAVKAAEGILKPSQEAFAAIETAAGGKGAVKGANPGAKPGVAPTRDFGGDGYLGAPKLPDQTLRLKDEGVGTWSFDTSKGTTTVD